MRRCDRRPTGALRHLKRVFAAALLAAATQAGAASFDPDLTWRTLETEHFRIHFHQGEEALADEFATSAEEVYATMTAEMRWEPRHRTEVVLVDRTDQANGYATTLPRNTIVVYVTAPEGDSTLGLYEDWNRAIFTHELTHILHLDTNRGIVRAVRWVIGRIASTNQLSPAWMVEGLATFQETRHTPGGRGRTPAVDMIKRTAVLEDAFPPLGNLDGFQAALPAGNLRYLFGQDFIQYIADQSHPDAWTDWTHTYGGHIPYLLPAKEVFGRRLPELYRGWKASLDVRYRAQAATITAEGIRDGRTVSDSAAHCIAPRWSPDGERIVWSCIHPKKGLTIWMADDRANAAEVLIDDRAAEAFTWRSDSQAFAYAGTHIVNRFNTWSDVYLHTLGSERPTALTSGARARDPAFSPDGSRLLVVTNAVQNNQLEVLTVDRRRTALTTNTDHTQYSTPRYSPDGERIAVSMWREGRRDLWLLDPSGQPLERLTDDVALDNDPEWSADGETLYFSSDRSGVPNIYALHLETRALRQVTNVLTGASAPSLHPDGQQLAYQAYSRNGWQVRVLDLSAQAPIDRGTLPHIPVQPTEAGSRPAPSAEAAPEHPALPGPGVPLPPFPPRFLPPLNLPFAQDPSEAIGSFEQEEARDVFGREHDYPFSYPVQRYNPLRTLAPTYWLPYFQVSPYPSRTANLLPGGFGWQATAATGGVDTLRQFAYGAQVSYRSDADFLGGGFGVTLNRWLPVYQFGASHSAVPYGEIPLIGEPEPIGSGERYWERRSQAYAAVSYPYTYRSTVFARYSLVHREALDPLPENTFLPGVPLRGNLGTIAGGWRYAWGKGTAFQISPEETRTVSLIGSVTHPWLGTSIISDDGSRRGITRLQATGEVREYVLNPWIPNHVLALRAGAGVTAGATEFMGNYQLGGSFGDAGYVVTPDEYRMLRGYAQSSDIGDMYWLGSAEYRAPLWRIDRGFGTLPLFLRYLSGAVFVDAGNAFTAPKEWSDIVDQPLIGVGGEVSLVGVAGWTSGFRLRAGYGVGLTATGYAPSDPRAFYVVGGASY